MPSLFSLFSSTSENTFCEKSLLLQMDEKNLPASPIILPQIPTISLSQSPFALSSPLLFSTPTAGPPSTPEITPTQDVPLTQEFLERLHKLRDNDFLSAEETRPAFLVLQRETDELKSQLLAAQLQLEEKEMEIRELREQLQAQPPPPPANLLQPVASKWKRKKVRKQERAAAAAAAAGSQSPGSDPVQLSPPQHQPPKQQQPPPTPGFPPTADSPPTSRLPRRPLPPPPPPPPTSLPSKPTIYVFHDSNLKCLTAEEVKISINSILSSNNNNNISNNIANYNVNPQATFTLPQTRHKIQHLTFKPNDIVVINTLTNDARHTKHRQSRTIKETKQMQATIISHLKAFIPPKNIVILESPPLLTSSTSDIFPYNDASFLIARQHGARFARTLIGEHHLFGDGYHIRKDFRHLLIKSVAAAAVNIEPHRHFSLHRPPHGNFGPWEAPNGQGILPQPHTYRGIAMAQPINFRRSLIRPLMNIQIRRPR